MTRRRAVFLDRDGTIIEDVSYPREPAQIRLLSGAADAVRRLNRAGLLAIVATNQSGIARGLLTRDDYERTERRLDELLAAQGAALDAHYMCPHLPEIDGPCECRKPGPLLYRQAAERFDVDLGESWWIGDRMRDVEPSRHFGGRGILVRTGPVAPDGQASEFDVAADLAEAVETVLAAAALHYLPPA